MQSCSNVLKSKFSKPKTSSSPTKSSSSSSISLAPCAAIRELRPAISQSNRLVYVAFASASRVSMHCCALSGTVYVEPRPDATFRVVSAPSSAVGSTISSDATVPNPFASFTLCFSPSPATKATLPRARTAATIRIMSFTWPSAKPSTSSLFSVFVHSAMSSIPST